MILPSTHNTYAFLRRPANAIPTATRLKPAIVVGSGTVAKDAPEKDVSKPAPLLIAARACASVPKKSKEKVASPLETSPVLLVKKPVIPRLMVVKPKFSMKE